MDKLVKMVQQLSKKYKETWTLYDRHVDVKISRRKRHQRVYLRLRGKYYFFISVVMGSASVRKNKQRWNELVLMTWQRNADHELVTFAFDKNDRLVGLIRHPVEYLDLEELEHYLITLTRECDRYEYLLAGQDRF